MGMGKWCVCVHGWGGGREGGEGPGRCWRGGVVGVCMDGDGEREEEGEGGGKGEHIKTSAHQHIKTSRHQMGERGKGGNGDGIGGEV